MRYLSVCSGIEAATVAWHPLGWQPLAFSEIEPFPAAVLAHHYPTVPNLGDMTKFMEWSLPDGSVDLLVGGTPCQSFSVAGLRKGLADPRGNLMLTYLAIAQRHRPRWIVWENVPGVLSSNRGRDFGTFLGALGDLGYGWSYRVLDAQWFGVAQRRRRVFVVGHLGDATRAAAVLFESESVRRNTPPSREAGQGIAATITRGFGDRGVDADQIANGNYAIANCLQTTCNDYSRADGFNIVIHETQDPCVSDVAFAQGRNNGGENVLVQPIPIDSMNHLNRGDNHSFGDFQPGAPSYTLTKGHSHAVASGMAVRRLTPVECERLQGFPDGYTNIPWRKKPEAPDGPRYKALGNSMATPVMSWIGERIARVEAGLSAAPAKS